MEINLEYFLSEYLDTKSTAGAMLNYGVLGIVLDDEYVGLSRGLKYSVIDDLNLIAAKACRELANRRRDGDVDDDSGVNARSNDTQTTRSSTQLDLNAASIGSKTKQASTNDTPQKELPDHIFRKKGQAWQVRFAGGNVFILRPSKGVAYLQILLENPGVSLSVIDLAVRVSKQPEKFSLGNSGGTADVDALREYHARLGVLEDELQEAKSDSDEARHVRLENEKESIIKEVRRNTSKFGKPRIGGDDRERIRKAVGNAIRRTISDINGLDSRLADHLSSPTLCIGMNSCYSPPNGTHWET